MTSEDFKSWMNETGIRRASQIVALLGVARNSAQIWVNDAKAGRDVKIKPTVALAMSAVAAGIPAWGT